jgi:hypothetical protein
MRPPPHSRCRVIICLNCSDCVSEKERIKVTLARNSSAICEPKAARNENGMSHIIFSTLLLTADLVTKRLNTRSAQCGTIHNFLFITFILLLLLLLNRRQTRAFCAKRTRFCPRQRTALKRTPPTAVSIYHKLEVNPS